MRRSIIGVIILLLPFLNTICKAQEKEKLSFRDQFVDSTDNAFDVSSWLSEVYGFFPLASIITEPATGFGISGGLVHIRRNKNTTDEGAPIPPDLSLIGGLYTENGTWGAILFHRGHWKKDRIRFDGAIGYLSANLDVYRQDPLGNTLKFGFNMEGPIFAPSLSFRIKNSRSFLGGQYTYLNLKTTFEVPIEQLPTDITTTQTRLSGLGLLYMWDSRDNTFTPNNGMYANSSFMVYNEILGSQLNYNRFDTHWLGFTNAIDKLVLGLRLDYRVALNDPPFYSLPFVYLRGVPAFRYQGQHIMVVETEERWDFSNRWSLVGFAGLGKGYGGSLNLDDSDLAYSLGAGIRYYLARIFNIYSGIDVARGPEQWAFYIQFGHYWNSL